MTTYNELRKINVNEHIERKGNLNYLSWSWAVDVLLQNDPTATWEFPEPKVWNETVMVFCNVTAFGKTMKMQLPVMDNRNNAIKNPDTRKISDATMRCLAKCIACFGIGLYIYAGSDLPEEEPVDLTDLSIAWVDKIKECSSIDELKEVYGNAYKALSKDKAAVDMISKAKDAKKGELA
jgi:hypothetical protein